MAWCLKYIPGMEPVEEDEEEYEEEDENDCCLDMTPECYACQNDLSVPKFCRKNPDFDGCTDVYDCMHDKSCVSERSFFKNKKDDIC